MKHDWPIVEAEPKTRQDIFDRVVRHYRAQPRRCHLEGNCLYRAGDGYRCFIGALIDDAHYDPGMECLRVKKLAKLFVMPHWFMDNLDFIADLQVLHDMDSNWREGRMDMVLELFAAERGLRMPAEGNAP